MAKKTAVLPLKRAVKYYYDPRTDLYCVSGAQDRKFARRVSPEQLLLTEQRSPKVFALIADVYKTTNMSLMEVNDQLSDDAAELSPTEQTMLLAFLMQAAGYEVKIVER